jgi:hypothetical protein
MFASGLLSAPQAVNRPAIEELTDLFRQDKQHGLGLFDNTTALLFVSGKPWPTSVRLHAGYPIEYVQEDFRQGWRGSSLRYAHLPLSALRAAKIWFSATPQERIEKCPRGDFFRLLSRFQSLPLPGMLQVEDGVNQWFVFLPGNHQPANQVLDIAVGQLVSDPAQIASALEKPGETIRIAYYPYHPEQSAWQEYCLHINFCEISKNILERYSQISGRAMLQSLVRTMNYFVGKYNWPITFQSDNVNGILVLPDLEETIQTYQYILSHLCYQVNLVVGKKLMRYMLTEFVSQIASERQANMQKLLPNEYDLAISFGG